MALYNNTFTTIAGNTTRDSSADKGAIYYLNGNSTNGRLNIGSNGIWIVGNNSHILYYGTTNHSFMSGTIKAEGLTFVARGVGERIDFSSANGGLETTDLTYVCLGSGNIFNHLENSKNKFSGFTRFIIDMTSGNAFIQFANREYQNIIIDVKASNGAVLSVYPARSHNGYTSFPAFGTKNATSLLLYKGTTATSHGRFYDPFYEGVSNNLLPMNINGGGSGNFCKEYFTLDLTNIADNEARARVVDSLGTIQFENNLTDTNLTLNDYSGNPLEYYNGKKIIPCQVREITTAISNSRNTISYIIRRLGYQEIRVDNLSMNAPVIIGEMLIDNKHDSSIDVSTLTGISVNSTTKKVTLTETRTPQEIYEYLKNWLVVNLSVDDFVDIEVSVISLFDGWSFVNTNNINGSFTDTNVDSFLTEKDSNEIRVLNPADDSLIYEGISYQFNIGGITINPVKVFVNLGGVWLEQKELLTLVQGSNEVDFGVAGALTSLPTNVWEYQERTLNKGLFK